MPEVRDATALWRLALLPTPVESIEQERSNRMEEDLVQRNGVRVRMLLPLISEQERSGTGDEKARSLVLLLTDSSTSRGPPATAHQQVTSGRLHEQGTSSNLQNSRGKSSSLRSRASLRELEVQARPELAVEALETQARTGPGRRRHRSWVAEGISAAQAWRRRPRSWVAEEHVLRSGGASNWVVQVLGGGGPRTWRRRSNQLGGTGPGRRRSMSWAATEQEIGRRRSWAAPA
ncbi:uncharacterized protein [Triticum aestivum]|uniref:uncharacterized protein n=1 Tax=Triticum aestivum TaxID=4565 RepID=UPI001D009F27|nr:uncharacterized protein LOC123101441 [Triticum aestivum]